MQEKIKKINWLYLLGYIFLPILVCAFCYSLSFAFFPVGTMAAILIMVPSILAIVWWVFAGSFIFKKKTKAFEKEFVAKGYKNNHTFYGRGKTVILDINQGVLGLVFFWNPCQPYILPASRIKKAWVDDGKMGSGFMEGSSRVSFLMVIDGIQIRVDTFISNQRFRMDDKKILTGISKADMMVQSIENAKKNSGKTISSGTSTSTKSASKSDTKSDTKSTSKDSSKAKK